MTEDEAHMMQCCGPDGCGRHNDNPYPARWCVGSACMAWRWSKPTVEPMVVFDERGTEIPRVKIGAPDARAWRQIETGRDRPDRAGEAPYRWARFALDVPGAPGEGYCGLAGQPA